MITWIGNVNVFYTEKQNHVRSNSPVRYVESSRTNGHAHGYKRNQVESSYSKTYESSRHEYQDSVEDRQRTPSPPIRRRSKEQVWIFFFFVVLTAIVLKFNIEIRNIKCDESLAHILQICYSLFFFSFITIYNLLVIIY